MRRFGQMAAALVLVLASAVSGVAGAQTTTSSTSTTAPATTTTTSPSITTTSTPPNPCVGRLCSEEPPGAVVSVGTRQIVADRGSYCWQSPTSPAPTCLATTIAPDYKPPTLVVTRGELVTVRFTAPTQISPTEVAILREGQPITLPATNPTQFRVDLPVGTYAFVEGLSARWLQGFTRHSIGLDVRAAAPSPTTGRPLALTG